MERKEVVEVAAGTSTPGCLGERIRVTPGLHVLTFDYESSNAQKANYSISFRRGTSTTPIGEELPIQSNNWQSVVRVVDVPEGVKDATLVFGAMPSATSTVVNRFDNVALHSLTPAVHIEVPQASGFEQSSVTLAGEKTWKYVEPHYSLQNLVPNGSFEDGLWQQSVGDCDNYDANGKLAMRLVHDASDGQNALELNATRHIACTGISIPVSGGGEHLLSFDYESPNASEASYYLGFNDPAHTATSDHIPMTTGRYHGWRHYSTVIVTPPGASKVSLVFYARATDGNTSIVNRYDNVSLISIPTISDAFYVVHNRDDKLTAPASITYDLVSPTKKMVHIKGMTSSFFLAFSESYQPQWQLQVNNDKIHGWLNGWSPFAKPDRIDDQYHYSLDDFLNGWYVDLNDLCSVRHLCTKNGNGMWDAELVIEFWPQRWFYLGGILSFTTLAICIGYLVWHALIGRKLHFHTGAASREERVMLHRDAGVVHVASRNSEMRILAFDAEMQSPRELFELLYYGLWYAWRSIRKRWWVMSILAVIFFSVGWYVDIYSALLWDAFFAWFLYRWETRVLGVFALLYLLSCPILLELGRKDWAEQMAVYAFFFFVMTITLKIVELWRDSKQTSGKIEENRNRDLLVSDPRFK